MMGLTKSGEVLNATEETEIVGSEGGGNIHEISFVLSEDGQ